MSKIKVVQIAMAASTDDTWLIQYLDDKGRVWQDNGKVEDVGVAVDQGVEHKNVWVSKWEQVELPEEPES